MPRKALITAGFLILFCGASLVAFFIFSPRPQKFVVTNFDSEPVRVVARWRDNVKDVGSIVPGGNVEFSVKGEGAMSFEIARKSGTGAKINEVYFTSGVTTHVEITHTSVQVKSNIGI